jgi:hypothetical protein
MIVSEVVASYNANHQINLLSARLESMAFRYNGATSAEDLSEYMEDHEATALAGFIAESQAELESLREAAEKMRLPFLTTEEESIFTDDALASLSSDEQFSLSYVLTYEEDYKSLYRRLYSIANKTR